MISLIKTGLLASAALCLSATALADQFFVEAGKTKPLRLKSAASSVALGNQNIAEVSVYDRNLLLVSGKTFGTTNILVFDKDGNTVYNADLVVTANQANLVTIKRAGSDFTYNCSPKCKDTIQIGDDSEHFTKTLSQLELQKELNE